MNPIINIENLRKSYDDVEVLKGINLKVYPGEIIGYIGPNGAGKSTTIKILLGLIDDYSGNIAVSYTHLLLKLDFILKLFLKSFY